MEERLGVFYGVSVGPGDPELLTVKACRVLKACPVIAAPQSQSGEQLALSIAGQAVDLMFRPSGVFRKASCIVECNGREIARKKAPNFTPGEMAVVTLKPETVAALDGDVTVRIERSEA